LDGLAGEFIAAILMTMVISGPPETAALSSNAIVASPAKARKQQMQKKRSGLDKRRRIRRDEARRFGRPATQSGVFSGNR
jgi:hypothetical protein